MNWQQQLRTQGFARFPRLTPEPLLKAALEAIEIDLSSNYDAERQTEYDNQSYCPDLKGTPPIMNLISQSPVHNLLDEIFEIDNIDWDKGQSAGPLPARAFSSRQYCGYRSHRDLLSSLASQDGIRPLALSNEHLGRLETLVARTRQESPECYHL